MAKINVALVFGGRSAEHEISLRSAQNVIEAIDKSKYNLFYVAIDKKGQWSTNTALNGSMPKFPLTIDQFTDVLSINLSGDQQFFVQSKDTSLPIDLFFPILHGPYGEDGTIQGLFRSLNIPFVGCDVLGSSVGMDKDVMKRLLLEAGIPIGKYLSSHRGSIPTFEEVKAELALPFYVKPANMGSSVGITKVEEKDSYDQAVNEAFKYDRKIIFEENIVGLELECAVLGNRNAKASAVGRITALHEFYTYESKYLDDKGYELEIPAKIGEQEYEEIRVMAIRVFEALEAEGLGRVDIFMKEDGSIIVNEINTLPGFTSISMYPMLWKEMGVSYAKLIDQLISLGLERYEERSKLSTSYLD